MASIIDHQPVLSREPATPNFIRTRTISALNRSNSIFFFKKDETTISGAHFVLMIDFFPDAECRKRTPAEEKKCADAPMHLSASLHPKRETMSELNG